MTFEKLTGYLGSQGWGDWASVLGLLVGVVGFAVTIYSVKRSRSAAESAQQAANDARQAILRTEVIASFASAVTVMDEVKRLHRAGAWSILPDRYSYLRRALISIRSNHPNLNENHRVLIQSAIEQFQLMESTVESHLAGNGSQLNAAKLNKIVTSQIDKLDDVLNSIKQSTQ